MTEPPEHPIEEPPEHPLENVSHLTKLVDQLETSMWAAIQFCALARQSNDDLELRAVFDKTVEANGFNVVSHALLSMLVLELAKICDFADNRRNRASIPTVLAILENDQILEDVVGEARHWPPGGAASDRNEALARRLIVEAQTSYSNDKTAGKLRSLKDHRIRHLAHALVGMDQKVDPLRYGYVFELLDELKPIVSKLCLAIQGRNVDFSQVQQSWDNYSDEFWRASRLGMAHKSSSHEV